MGGAVRYARVILSVELECSARVRELMSRLCTQCSVSVNVKKAMWLCLHLYLDPEMARDSIDCGHVIMGIIS